MYVHAEARLIYLAHPRTASVATATALKRVGFHKLEPPSDHHSRLWDLGTPVTAATRAEWTVFTTVRNHFDAAVSWVFRRFKTRGGEPREWDVDAFRFALGDANRWTSPKRMWWLHGDDADVLLRFERLEHDLAVVLGRAGVEAPAVARHNVSARRAGRPYQEFYTDATRHYVEGRFGGEMRQLGYHF